MSGSTGTGPRDQRDIDEELLSRTPAPRTPPASPDDELQKLLDRATGGLVPRWENTPDRHRPDDRCVVYASPREDRRCHRDAEVNVWIGCPHEHVARSGVCGSHAIELETAKFGWRCNLCYEASGTVVLAYYIRTEPLENADLGSS